jgi:ribosomal protein S27AE
MQSRNCPSCGSPMRRNGKTTAGRQRWRCGSCGASATHSCDVDVRELKRFLDWLLSKERQADMPGGGRTFRRHTARFWNIWPIPEPDGEIHRVVYVDGIYLARDVVVLIARSDEYVLSWYLARSETSRAYEALIAGIAPPAMVVTDGGSGFASACSKVWRGTRVQRCLYHVFCQVRRYTTTRPKLQAGIELYALALDLLHIETLHEAELWVERFIGWCEFWNDFLEERTRTERGMEYTHERLRKARASVVAVLNKKTLFTYLDPELTIEGPLPSTNNRIEGGTNAKIRDMLRNHRGMKVTKRIKATFWLCYMDTERPLSASEILRSMPTDIDMDLLRAMYSMDPRDLDEPVEWGTGLVWSEFHSQTRYPFEIE